MQIIINANIVYILLNKQNKIFLSIFCYLFFLSLINYNNTFNFEVVKEEDTNLKYRHENVKGLAKNLKKLKLQKKIKLKLGIATLTYYSQGLLESL